MRFGFTVFDGGYGHLPWLLRALDDERETFLAEVHSDQAIYLTKPSPAVPQRVLAKGKEPCRLQAQIAPLSVADWSVAQPPSRWRRLSVREADKGHVVAEYLSERVWLCDGAEKQARCWHMLVRREIDGSTLKFCLSNCKPTASLRHMADMQASQHFVERVLEDATGACRMGPISVPSKVQTDGDLVASVNDRHRRRQLAKASAYRKQAAILAASG